MRETSAAFRRAAFSQQSDEVFLTLVKLSHADFADDIRLVNDWHAVTHQSATYQPFAFTIELPDDETGVVPVLSWSADMVTLDLIRALRSITGAISARVVQVLRSSPDTIEIDLGDVELRAIEYNARSLSGTMTIEPVLEQSVSRMTFTPSTTPGLF